MLRKDLTLIFQAAKQSAGEQMDARCDKNLAGLDAKVKSIIADTVKSQSIKKEAILFDTSLLECDVISSVSDRHSTS